MKYIVKNCGCNPSCDECYNRCADISDCLIKQVIEKCKENLGFLETYLDVRSYPCTKLQEILQLFDIEEINK